MSHQPQSQTSSNQHHHPQEPQWSSSQSRSAQYVVQQELEYVPEHMDPPPHVQDPDEHPSPWG